MPRNHNLTTEQRFIIGLIKYTGTFFKWLFSLFTGKKKVHISLSNQIKPISQEQKNEISNKWREIMDLLAMGGASQAKQALMEADKLFDHALKIKNIQGSNMGERLKNSEEIFSRYTYNNIWSAHKLRNVLAHEVNGEILNYQIKEQLQHFAKGLEELGIL